MIEPTDDLGRALDLASFEYGARMVVPRHQSEEIARAWHAWHASEVERLTSQRDEARQQLAAIVKDVRSVAVQLARLNLPDPDSLSDDQQNTLLRWCTRLVTAAKQADLAAGSGCEPGTKDADD